MPVTKNPAAPRSASRVNGEGNRAGGRQADSRPPESADQLADLPEPPIPPDCDLSDFGYSPIFRARLFASAFHARTTDSEWRCGVTLWLKSMDQLPSGSLPIDDIELARLAELGRDMRAWKKVKLGALRGWYECNDGRLYHAALAEDVLVALGKRTKASKKGLAGARRRWANKDAQALPQPSDSDGTGMPQASSDDGTGITRAMPGDGKRIETNRLEENRLEKTSPQTTQQFRSGPTREGQQGAASLGKEDLKLGLREVDLKQPLPAQIIMAYDLERVRAFGREQARQNQHRDDSLHAQRFIDAGADLHLCQTVFSVIMRQRALEGSDATSGLAFFAQPISNALKTRGKPLPGGHYDPLYFDVDGWLRQQTSIAGAEAAKASADPQGSLPALIDRAVRLTRLDQSSVTLRILELGQASQDALLIGQRDGDLTDDALIAAMAGSAAAQ